jgi:hypothetical protein
VEEDIAVDILVVVVVVDDTEVVVADIEVVVADIEVVAVVESQSVGVAI